MIDIETSWEDSGYDCDHCGGKILLRTDRETGQPPLVCYQCELCGCQWELSGDVQRTGSLPSCIKAQRERSANQQGADGSGFSPVIVSVVLGGLLLLLFLMGGLAAIRFVVPIAIAAFVFLALYRFGKERMWW